MTHCPATGKFSYPSSDAARQARAALIAKPGYMKDHTAVFHCDGCGGFHLGRTRRQGKRQMRRTPPHERGSVISKLSRYRELTK